MHLAFYMMMKKLTLISKGEFNNLEDLSIKSFLIHLITLNLFSYFFSIILVTLRKKNTMFLILLDDKKRRSKKMEGRMISTLSIT